MAEIGADFPQHRLAVAGSAQRVPLRGEHLARLQAALLDAFDLNSLEHMLQIQLDCDLSTIVALRDNNLNDIVRAVVRWAIRNEAVGVQGLLRAARTDNPGNYTLAALYDEWLEIVFDLRPACPYPGMRSFAGSQSHQFYGRSAEVEDAVLRLRLHPFLIVIGPSGSGKSSLAFAGIAPALQQTRWLGPQPLQVCSLRPGAAPLAALSAALRQEQASGAMPLEQLTAAVRRRVESAPLLLIVDQFEETFTLAPPAEALQFQEALQQLAGLPSLVLLLTARADFYPSLMNSPLWPAIQAHRLEITTLGEKAVREAIVNPARDVGVTLEGSLVERLVADAAGEPGALPFLQETLVLLWEQVSAGQLPLAAYTALAGSRSGQTGLQVAMSLRADAALAEPPLPAQGQQIARRILLRLVQFGEGRPNTRRQQTEAELCAAGDDPATFAAVLARLVERRLLIASGDSSRGANGGDGGPAQRRIDIAHEAVISGWPLLHTWVVERRQAEIERRRLEGKAMEWVRLGRADAALLDRVEMKEANAYLTGADGADLGASVDLLALVEASGKSLDPGWNQRGVLALAGGAVAVLALLAAGLFYLQTNLLALAVRVALLLFWGTLALVLVILIWLLRRSDPLFLKRWSHAISASRLWQGGLALGTTVACLAWLAIGVWALPIEQQCRTAGFSRGSGFDQIAIVSENTQEDHAVVFAHVLERVSGRKAEAQAVSRAIALDCASFLTHIVILGIIAPPDGDPSFFTDQIDPNSGERSRLLTGYPVTEGCQGLLYLATDTADRYLYVNSNLDRVLLAAGDPPCDAVLANEQGLALLDADYQRAQERFLAALNVWPPYVDARVNWGITYAKAGDWTRAIESYEFALELLPQPSRLVLSHLGLACYFAQRMECAEDATQRALELTTDTASRLRLINTLFQIHRYTGDWQQAKADFQQYSTTLPALVVSKQEFEILAAKAQGVLAFEEQRWDDAARFWAEADNWQDFRPDDWLDLGRSWLSGRNEYQARWNHYHKWGEEIVYYLAMTAEKQGRLGAACDYWRRYQVTADTYIYGQAERRSQAEQRSAALGCNVQ